VQLQLAGQIKLYKEASSNSKVCHFFSLSNVPSCRSRRGLRWALMEVGKWGGRELDDGSNQMDFKPRRRDQNILIEAGYQTGCSLPFLKFIARGEFTTSRGEEAADDTRQCCVEPASVSQHDGKVCWGSLASCGTECPLGPYACLLASFLDRIVVLRFL